MGTSGTDSLSDTCKSASSGCALLLGLRLLASGFLLLASHLHRVFLPRLPSGHVLSPASESFAWLHLLS